MNKGVVLGVDIGGSHISAALVDAESGRLVENTFCKERVAVHENGGAIIRQWMGAMQRALDSLASRDSLAEWGLLGVGIAVPGPFEYERGVSLIEGVNKYDSLYGLNIGDAVRNGLGLGQRLPIAFENDAACFGLGETLCGAAAGMNRVIAVTVGTGFGATFIKDNRILKEGEGVPPGGILYNIPFRDGIAEDFISSRWISNSYEQLSGRGGIEPREIAGRAMQQDDRSALEVFQQLGENIAGCILPWARAFGAEAIVLGGSISQAWRLFLPVIREKFEDAQFSTQLIPSGNMELSAIAGAAHLLHMETTKDNMAPAAAFSWRRTSQPLMPMETRGNEVTADAKELAAGAGKIAPGEYDLYPYRRLGNGKIFRGYGSLGEWIGRHKRVVIDGYVGNDWKTIREEIGAFLERRNVKTMWYESFAFEKSEAEIESLVAAFLGEPGSVWGKRTSLSLRDLFRMDKLAAIDAGNEHDLTVVIGHGAALCGWDAPIVYVDLPKNELQFRMRAGSITNLGARKPERPGEMYKRLYFVDWVLMNRHRQDISQKIRVIADGQWKEDITWAFADAIRKGLSEAARNVFRVRPWFEPGAWGGQWLKNHIPALPQDEVNYAWSFELIVPENGLVFESDGLLLEIAVGWLMEQECVAVLGEDGAGRYGTEFPIRFDFLDTFEGGNLSIQCHPSLSYIQEKFGENITQDETYYILDCEEGAGVYLGFQEGVEAGSFRYVLENSVAENVPVDIEQYVQKHPARKHDLFLIPNRTVHSAGAGNLVLEISATPYIFTFKMYDWLRLDLNGEPRPINIGHAFNNLDFTRQGARVREELLSRPAVIESGEGFRIVHLPTHPDHFYDVHRVEFLDQVKISTEGRCHVLMLVEGQSVIVTSENGESHRFSYAETFVIPAAAGAYSVVNAGKGQAFLIKAFLK